MTLVSNFKSSSGQSVAEVLIVLAVLVPLLLTIASFSNLLTLNTETVEAARFAAWERTVYGDREGVEDRIAKNIDDIYLTKKYSDFAPGSNKSSGIPSIVDKSLSYSQRVSLNVPEGDISGTEIANKDTALANKIFGGLNSNGGGNMAMRSPEVSIALNSDYSLLKTISYQNYNRVEYEDPSLPYDEIAGRSQFNVSSSAALIANGWMPEDDEDLSNVTHDAAFDGGALRSFESANPAFRFFGFREAGLPAQDGGYNTVAQDSDAYVPPDP